MFFRLLNQNPVGTFLLLAAVGVTAFWGLLAMIGGGASNLVAWTIPILFLALAAAHLIARPLVRKRLGLTPIR